MISYVNEDAFNHIGDHDAMLVGTNLYASMANGFQLDVSLNYPYVFDANVSSKYGDIKKLGTILECKKDELPTFILCFITVGYNFRPDLSKDYLNYGALENCLKLVNASYSGMNIGAPLLGVSKFEGYGDRTRIEEIFKNSIKDVNFTIYDYDQMSRAEKVKDFFDKEQAVKKLDKGKYYQMVKERKDKANERFALNGRRRY